jgi:hypothetical protein
MNDDFKKMSQDIQNRISEMAYLMWETAGRQQGMAMEYWLAAEKEVMTTAQKAAERMMPQEKKASAKTAKPKAETAKPAAKPAASKPTASKTAAPRKTAS